MKKKEKFPVSIGGMTISTYDAVIQSEVNRYLASPSWDMAAVRASLSAPAQAICITLRDAQRSIDAAIREDAAHSQP